MNASVSIGAADLAAARLTGHGSATGYQVYLGMHGGMSACVYGTASDLRAAGERLIELAARADVVQDDCEYVAGETFECDRCGAKFGISGGPIDDGEATEYFERDVDYHRSGECVAVPA